MGCPSGADGRGCGHDGTTTSLSPLSPLLEFAIGGGRDWAAPEVQVRMRRGSPACDRGAGTGGGVAQGGGLGRLRPGWAGLGT